MGKRKTSFWNWVRSSSYAATRVCLRIAFRVLYGYRVSGRENLPRGGPVILAANHMSYLDPILVAIGQPRRLRAMAWKALFRGRWFGAVLRWLGAFPVDNTTWDVAAYRAALNSLKDDGWLIIFPEGQRSPDGAPQPLRPGVAHLAMRAGASVVPVRIEGSYDAWPRHRRLPSLFRRCRVRYGKPIPAPSLNGRGPAARHAAAEQLLVQLRADLERPIGE
jgi:1-acyl-sn-glycerol-3-phosphate acyltransferase